MMASRRDKSPSYRMMVLCVAVASFCVLLGSGSVLAQTDTPTPTPSDTTAPTNTPTATPTTDTPTPTTVAPTPTPTTAAPTPTTVAPTPAPTTIAPTPSPTPTPTTAAPTPTPTTVAPTPTITPAPATTPVGTCGPRIRRAWGTLATSDKQLYLDAVMKAMATGHHALFLEVHADAASGNEAHMTCGMIYWHRRFILAYENMLRSLEPRFACLTIPYWDYFSDFAKRSAGLCTTLEGCSTFLSEFGGSSGPASTYYTSDGVALIGSCISTGIPSGTTLTYTNGTATTIFTIETNFSLGNFCQNSTATGSACWKCMPRGTWTTTAFPSGFGYSSLAKLISGSFGFSNFAQNLQYNVHNAIHSSAGSMMATLSTSADPIFYNHHSMMDLVHQMWYDCQVKRPMTEYEKKNSAYGFATCSQSAAVAAPSRLANITQYLSNGTDHVRADDHPVLGAFFSPLPTQYWQYVSGSDLGDYSYTYEKDALLQSLADAKTAISCPAQSKARRMASTQLQQPTESPPKSKDSSREKAVGRVKGLIGTLTPMVLELADDLNDALEQMELMECAWYVHQHHFVDDYTEDFRNNMKFKGHTRCYNLIMSLLNGTARIDMKHWLEVYKAFMLTAAPAQVAASPTTSGAAPVISAATSVAVTPDIVAANPLGISAATSDTVAGIAAIGASSSVMSALTPNAITSDILAAIKANPAAANAPVIAAITLTSNMELSEEAGITLGDLQIAAVTMSTHDGFVVLHGV